QLGRNGQLIEQRQGLAAIAGLEHFSDPQLPAYGRTDATLHAAIVDDQHGIDGLQPVARGHVFVTCVAPPGSRLASHWLAPHLGATMRNHRFIDGTRAGLESQDRTASERRVTSGVFQRWRRSGARGTTTLAARRDIIRTRRLELRVRRSLATGDSV